MKKSFQPNTIKSGLKSTQDSHAKQSAQEYNSYSTRASNNMSPKPSFAQLDGKSPATSDDIDSELSSQFHEFQKIDDLIKE